MDFMCELAEQNRMRYLKQPTMEEIDSFIKFCRVSELQFERFFRIAAETIKNVRNGDRPLPAKYWHIFYERKIPIYGSDNELSDNPSIKNTGGILVGETKQDKPLITPTVTIHSRFSALK